MTAIKVFDAGGKRLADLKDEANAAAEQVELAGSDMVSHAIASGEALTEIKKALPHGKFGEWLADNFEYGQQRASRYMEMSKYASRRDLTSCTSIAEALRMIEQTERPNIRQRVLNEITKAGKKGITDENLAAKLDEKPSSVRGRRSELCKDGLVKAHGKIAVGRVDGKKAKPQTVWVAVPKSKDEEIEKARKANEKRERKEEVDRVVSTIRKMAPAAQREVVRRLGKKSEAVHAMLPDDIDSMQEALDAFQSKRNKWQKTIKESNSYNFPVERFVRMFKDVEQLADGLKQFLGRCKS